MVGTLASEPFLACIVHAVVHRNMCVTPILLKLIKFIHSFMHLTKSWRMGVTHKFLCRTACCMFLDLPHVHVSVKWNPRHLPSTMPSKVDDWNSWESADANTHAKLPEGRFITDQSIPPSLTRILLRRPEEEFEMHNTMLAQQGQHG